MLHPTLIAVLGISALVTISLALYRSLIFVTQTWDYFATRLSPNKNVKIFLGVPASSTAAGSGFVDLPTLTTIVQEMRANFSSFGGVMMWDER